MHLMQQYYVTSNDVNNLKELKDIIDNATKTSFDGITNEMKHFLDHNK